MIKSTLMLTVVKPIKNLQITLAVLILHAFVFGNQGQLRPQLGVFTDAPTNLKAAKFAPGALFLVPVPGIFR